MNNATNKTLDELPNEILLLVFSYLSPKTILLVISLVCKKFRLLTKDENYWRRRLAQKFLIFEYPECAISSNNFTFQRACIETEHEYLKWSRYKDTFHHAVLGSGHYASVDAVHLLKKDTLCISGSRDRNLCLWDLTNLKNGSRSPIHCQTAAHHGWIWSIASLGDLVFTGSWDQTVGEWQLTDTGLSHIRRMKCTTAVLSVLAEQDLVIAGTFGSRIVLFDRRSDSQQITSLNIHGRAVLSVATNGQYLYSCGEDKYVYCVDRRTWTVVCRSRLDNYGMSLSLLDNQLWISDSNGKVHLFDARSERFGVLNTVPIVEPKRRITDIKHNLGNIVCLSADKTLRAYSGGLHPQSICKIDLPSEPTKLSINSGSIACGFTDGTIGIWRYKPEIIV